MARKKHKEDHVNHEAWAIPYGDLVTLLLAFFVVMYAVSSVNEGKYRALSDSLVAAFRGAPRTMEPLQVGAYQVRADQELETGLPRTLVPFEVDAPFNPIEEATERSRYGETGLGPGDGSGIDPDDSAYVLIQQLEDEVLAAMAPLVDADMISVRRVSYWLEVEINTNFLFASGSATVASTAVPAIQRLAGLLKDAGVRLQVEGTHGFRADQHRAVPLQLGAVGRARRQRRAPAVRLRHRPGRDGRGRLRRVSPRRGQRQPRGPAQEPARRDHRDVGQGAGARARQDRAGGAGGGVGDMNPFGPLNPVERVWPRRPPGERRERRQEPPGAPQPAGGSRSRCG
jgi:flagellar motor protein MotB